MADMAHQEYKEKYLRIDAKETKTRGQEFHKTVFYLLKTFASLAGAYRIRAHIKFIIEL